MDSNLGRLQVELYKEIKRNGGARSLRAALSRFAEMARLIRPLKCRPYIVNLLPCLQRIAQRTEESVQETLGEWGLPNWAGYMHHDSVTSTTLLKLKLIISLNVIKK